MNESNIIHVDGKASNLMEKIFLILSIIEIIFHVFTYCISIFCFYVLTRNPFFHIHLIRSFKCVFIYYVISQLMRLVIIVDEIGGGGQAIGTVFPQSLIVY